MSTFQTALDQHARELLPLCLRLYIFVYVVVVGAHVLILPGDIAGIMIGAAVSCIFLGFLVRANIDRPVVQNNAENVFALLLLLMAANVVLHMALTVDIKQTTNFIFIMALAGYVLPTTKIYYSTLACLVLAWFALLFFMFPLDRETVHFGFEMLLGLMLAGLLHTLRRGQLKQVAELSATAARLTASQNKIASTEAMLTSLLDNIPAGIVLRSQDSRVLYANSEVKAQLGHDDMVGMSITESARRLVSPTGRILEFEEYPVNQVLASGESVINTVVGIEKDNADVIWGLVNAFPLAVAGDEEDIVAVAFVNITDQVNAELRLKETEIRDSVILQSIQDGVISVDRQNCITRFNAGAERLTGYESAAVLGEKIDIAVDFEATEAVDAEGTEISQGILRSASGEEIAVEFHVAEIVEGDEHVGWVHTLRDVREQRRLEQERTTLDKINSVGVLAAGIAHDFNNLLTAIYGNVALAESVIPENDQARVFLQRSSESIRLATNLTKQLVTFSSGSEPVRRVMALIPLVEEAADFVLSGSSMIPVIDAADDLAAVNVDAVQLQQAIGNVVMNAKEAMSNTGEINIRLYNQNNDTGVKSVVVSITDTGPGMTEDLVAKVFDPYFTTRPNGTGLGLATTHSIVTKHGGSISVISEYGKGTTVDILLPAADATPAVNPAGSSVAAEPGSSFHVLVMDDDEVVLETMVKLLEQLGHRVQRATDGKAAIECYAQQFSDHERFDFVIMDLTVAGGMGGMAAAESILDIDPEARLVVTSGYSAGAEMARYDELGFSARLEKPFRASELKNLIAEVTSR